MESWLLADRAAVLAAYPDADVVTLDNTSRIVFVGHGRRSVALY